MKSYELVFEEFNSLFNNELILKDYDATNIQYDCLKESIDYFESKNGRLSDYGLTYIKYIARAC